MKTTFSSRINSVSSSTRRSTTGAISICSLTLVLFFGFLISYSILAFWLLQGIPIPTGHVPPTRPKTEIAVSVSSAKSEQDQTKVLFGIPINNNYDSWLNVTLYLAQLSPSHLLSTLEQTDPFGVRAFDSALIQIELQRQRTLTPSELAQLFPCPRNGERLTLPIRTNQTKARLFRENIHSFDTNNQHFLFFQHLRKAGGTHFCSLAKDNIPPTYVPDYFCMPDWEWSHFKTAGYLHSYTNLQLTTHQREEQWRILGNEWQPFRSKHHSDSHLQLPAVFATSFRKPLHRALSQFRFECLENRGCTIKNVTRWWEMERHLKNVYVSTFADLTDLGGYYIACHDMTVDAVRKRRDYMEHAVNVLSQFHLVLVMEWLAYSQPLLQAVLGFQKTEEGVVQRVRPHVVQAQRVGGTKNYLGAAGIQTDGSSWEPQDYLDNYTFTIMSQDLALDSLLTDVARRMFLERTVCGDTIE